MCVLNHPFVSLFLFSVFYILWKGEVWSCFFNSNSAKGKIILRLKGMKPFDFKWRLWRVGGNVECFSSWVCVVEFISWCSCRHRVADRRRPYRGLEIIDVLQEQIEPSGPSRGSMFFFIFTPVFSFLRKSGRGALCLFLNRKFLSLKIQSMDVYWMMCNSRE